MILHTQNQKHERALKILSNKRGMFLKEPDAIHLYYTLRELQRKHSIHFRLLKENNSDGLALFKGSRTYRYIYLHYLL